MKPFRRYFPLQKRRLRRLWHPSEFNRRTTVTITAAESDYVYGNMAIVKKRAAHLPVDWSAAISDNYDPVKREYSYHLKLRGPRLSAKIRKLYES